MNVTCVIVKGTVSVGLSLRGLRSVSSLHIRSSVGVLVPGVVLLLFNRHPLGVLCDPNRRQDGLTLNPLPSVVKPSCVTSDL